MSLGARAARARKAIAAAVGFAVTLVLLVPQDVIPDGWRPYVALLLAAGTTLGVYKVRNDPVARGVRSSREDDRSGYS